MDRPAPVVAKFYLYNVLLSHGFVVPVVAEFMLARGLTLAELGAVNALFMIGWVASEVPTGYVGDRIGRRRSLALASVASASAIALLGVGRSFAVFVAAHLLWAVGVTFRSGTGDAWLYDVLGDRLDESEFTRVKSRGWSVRQVTTAVAGIVGAYLADIRWVYPFAANAVLVLAGVAVILTLPRAGVGRSDDGDDGDHLTVNRAVTIVRTQFARPDLRWFVVYAAAFFALIEAVSTFVQPISTGLGVPVAALGWLYAGFSLVAAAASYVAEPIRDRLGIRGWFLLAPPAVAFALAGAGLLVPLALLPGFFLMRGVRSVTGTLRSQYLNDRIRSFGRATVLSTASLVFALGAAGGRFLAGWLADLTSPAIMVALLGAGFVVTAVALWATVSPVRPLATGEQSPRSAGESDPTA